MNLTVDVQVASEGDDNPDPDSIRSWLQTALTHSIDNSWNDEQALEVCVRIVDETESQTLNNQYRQKNSPTNVLSFPADILEDIPEKHLGDIVVCNNIVRQEAASQGKECRAHWAHMIVHGTLHLVGYDHIQEDEAEVMESLETKILSALAFPSPYQSTQ